MHRPLLLVALAAAALALPRAASAQFTTFIPPQSKVADSIKAAVAAQQKAQADSAAKMQLTNMQTWVDSAAGVAPAPTTAADSLANRLAATNAAALDTMAFRSGTRAPATASDLPLLALIGGVAFAIGTVLLAGTSSSRSRHGRA
jgi:hypothetical protein